jgi:hypothetical protein
LEPQMLEQQSRALQQVVAELVIEPQELRPWQP